MSVVWLLLCFTYFTVVAANYKCAPLSPQLLHRAEKLARQWAPLVWLAPGERYYPSSVLHFLEHTRLRADNGTPVTAKSSPLNNKMAQEDSLKVDLPVGITSKNTFLETVEDLDDLLSNYSSWLHGHSPHMFSVPVYAVISPCCKEKYYQSSNSNRNNNEVLKSYYGNDISEIDFQVTFWLFFPFSEGKQVCTVNAGALGPIPFPWLRTACLGKVMNFGSHVGDWEHVTISFKGAEATSMYVSTHDLGAIYSPPTASRDARQTEGPTSLWTYTGHEKRRGGRLVNPSFPWHAVTLKSGRPVLFAARGSHGLWTLPGRHKYVTFPNLVDETGFGTAWHTWQNLQIISWPPSSSAPHWLGFQGHWGNPRSGCHPLSKQVCQISEGPRGIPSKKNTMRCVQLNPLFLIKRRSG